MSHGETVLYENFVFSLINILIDYNSEWLSPKQMGMLFVRCRGGISHSPAEHVLDDDVWAAGLAVLAFLENHV